MLVLTGSFQIKSRAEVVWEDVGSRSALGYLRGLGWVSRLSGEGLPVDVSAVVFFKRLGWRKRLPRLNKV